MRANWTVRRVTLTDANTQYSQALTTECNYVLVTTTSDTASFKLSLIADQVDLGTKYRTINSGIAWESKMPMFGTKTIYLASATAGIEIEIEEWS